MAADARNRASDAPSEETRRESSTIRARASRAGFTPSLADALMIRCLATPTVVGQVRTMLGYRLIQWRLPPSVSLPAVSDNLRLIASELLTNAINKTPDKIIQIECALDDRRRAIRFAVWDSSHEMPHAHMPTLVPEAIDLSPEKVDRNGGWGLPLVQALADSCGVTRTERGKWVWAILKVPRGRT